MVGSIQLNNLARAKVMTIAIRVNGVPGPNQNAQHALPMVNHIFLLVIMYRRYGTQTSALSTTLTIP